jgi:hypothetical protein
MTTDDTPRKDEDGPHTMKTVWVVMAPKPTLEALAEQQREMMATLEAIAHSLRGISRDLGRIRREERARQEMLEALQREKGQP